MIILSLEDGLSIFRPRHAFCTQKLSPTPHSPPCYHVDLSISLRYTPRAKMSCTLPTRLSKSLVVYIKSSRHTFSLVKDISVVPIVTWAR